jgi:hypothetical protein
MVENIILFGLEGKSSDPDAPHERPVSKENGRRIDVPGERKPIACTGLPFLPSRWSKPLRHENSPLWRVAIAAPSLPILRPRASANLGNPQVEDPRLSETGKIADGVQQHSNGKREKASSHEEDFRRDGGVDHEKAVGDAREHLRPSQGSKHGRFCKAHQPATAAT